MKRKRKSPRLDLNSKEFDIAVEVMTLLGCDECFRRLGDDVLRLDETGPLMAQIWPDKYSVCGWRVVCDDCADRLDKGR